MLGRAVVAWWNDNAMRLGASVAYYTLFALGPVLLIAIAVAGAVFGPDAVRGEVVSQIDQLVGAEGARAVQALLRGAARDRNTVLASVIGGVTLFLAACGAFLELQAAFNAIWKVKTRPESRIRDFLLDRLRSFGIMVAIGFLLLVSLLVSAALGLFGQWLSTLAPGIPTLLGLINWVVSLTVIAVLFTLLFKFLPDARLAWADVAAGGVATAVLFTIGKHLIGLYLGRSAFASSYAEARVGPAQPAAWAGRAASDENE